MKRAGFTMIELIFVIVILGILAAVALPKMSAVKDDAQLANANENICVNLKGPLLSYAVRHGGSLQGADLDDYVDLVKAGFATVNAFPAAATSGSTLNPVDANTSSAMTPLLSNTTNRVYVYFTDGNDTNQFGCFVGNLDDHTGTNAQTARDNNNNYL